MNSRRGFLAALAASAGVGARLLHAQPQQRGTAGMTMDTTNLFAMDQSAAHTVVLPAKPGAKASMTPDERDALEHRIRCQCGCTLDVYTCRTTDFSCQVSPQMHGDVMALVDGGYSAQEILDAFVHSYGERVLMAPRKQGFNAFGYVAPAIALGVGAVVVAILIRRWAPHRATPDAAMPASLDATSEELDQVAAAVRRDR